MTFCQFDILAIWQFVYLIEDTITILIMTLLIMAILVTLNMGDITDNDITYNRFYLWMTLL